MIRYFSLILILTLLLISLTIIGGDITICGPNRGDTASLDYDLTGTTTKTITAD